MKKMFYSRLAFRNIRKNASIYVPYLLTGICTVMLYYMISSLSVNPYLKAMKGGYNLIQLLQAGSGLTAFFAFVFMLYTNGFLIKQRKKEIGLYNILGMEKRHIAKVLAWESMIVSGVGVLGGILAGMLFEKLIFVLLLRIVDFPVTFGFSVSAKTFWDTTILFIVIYALCLIRNLFSVWRARPVELLHDGKAGEKEPKTKWLLALIGVVSLGSGYGIALFTKNPIDAIMLFLLAVILVMIGTHCLFRAGSIVVLKLLRKNKKYYYQPGHFISVSGMIYRMKQNAAGLANICILSCAVLVSISTTLSLYVGEEDILQQRYKGDLVVTRRAEEVFTQGENTEQRIRETISEMGLEVTKMIRYQELSFAVRETEEETFTNLPKDVMERSFDYVMFSITTLEDYNREAGKSVSLEEDEILLYGAGKQIQGQITLQGDTYRIAGEVSEDFVPWESIRNNQNLGIDAYYCVVSSDAVLNKIYEGQKSMEEGRNNELRYYFMFDTTGTQEEKTQAAIAVSTKETDEDMDGSFWVESKDEKRQDFYATYGGMLFLGIFLGLIFALATVLIIYYKQITEGLEDRERFVIMQKVGMSFEEVRKTISGQVLAVFYLPLIVACVHLAVAFPVICKLLLLFGLTNRGLFAISLIGCIIVFAVLYGMIYMMTARVYYKIVRGIER